MTHMPSVRQISGGLLGGLAGGLLFGVLMQSMGIMPLVAQLAGGDSALEGWMVHAVVSVIAGAVFPCFFKSVAISYPTALWSGFAYGLLWWVLGPLTIMPIWLGAGPQYSMAFTPLLLTSLVGHLLFGMTLGLVYRLYTRASVPMIIPRV